MKPFFQIRISRHLAHCSPEFFSWLTAVVLLFLFSMPLPGQDFTYKEKKEMANFPDYTMQAGYSPFRNWFVVCIGNNTLEIYDKNWKKVFTHQSNPKAVGGHFTFSPDEKYLAYAKYKSNSDIAIIRMSDLKVMQVLQGHTDHISKLAFSNNGKILASCSSDNTMRTWQWQGDELVPMQVFSEHSEGVEGVSFSFDDRFLATGGEDKKLVIREFRNGKYEPFATIEADRGYIRDVAFHPLRYDILVGSYNGVKRWRFGKNTFMLVDSLPEDFDVNMSLCLSPTGDYGVFGHNNQTEIFSITDKKMLPVETIYRSSDHVFGGAFSDDGMYLTTFGSDKNFVIWELTGVKPSERSVIAGCLDNRLTSAQKSILTPVILRQIIDKLDKNLLLPRDEFETTADYNQRRQQLADEVLGMLQDHVEKEYRVSEDPKKGQVKIPIERIIGYNADLGIYKVAFLETEAGIKIPVPQARAFKAQWQNAYILADKKTLPGKKSFSYSHFALLQPGDAKTYEVIPVENPFRIDEPSETKETAGIPRSATSTEGKTEDIDISKFSQVNKVSEPGGVVVNHALLFATDQYDAFPELINPVYDATTISDELKDSYGFDTELVLNPTLNETISKIREYAEREYSQKDNLLILFAGHGIFDDVFKEGYIISKDSRADDLAKTSYLSHSNLRTMVNNIPCPHIFLIMDVCFGGTFDPLLASGHRGGDMYAGVTNQEFIDRKMQYKTRLYLTSGGKEYVPDGRPGQHSPFTRKLLEALRNYGGQDKILTISEIMPFIEKVDPQPRFGEFGDNEPGSDFIMVSK